MRETTSPDGGDIGVGVGVGVKVLFLGTGTSTGVPMIGCDCETCESTDEKDNRTRCSALMSWRDGSENRNILVDASTDLRIQSLRAGLRRIDAALFTHPHADHIHGIDELRSFNFIQKSVIPCYGSSYTLSRIRSMFDYIFDDKPEGGAIPKISLHEVDGEFTIFGRKIIPLHVKHGTMDVLGFRFGNMAYMTDCNFIPDSTFEKIQGVKLLILGAIQTDFHATHMNVAQAIEVSRRAKAQKTYITHLNHNIHHRKLGGELPENVFLAYDGLEEIVEA